MSDEELETELMNRGKEVAGTREQKIETLTALDRGLFFTHFLNKTYLIMFVIVTSE